MDGDIPRARRSSSRSSASTTTLLLVDEAHSLGVLGRRRRAASASTSTSIARGVDLWMGTLSKSLASCGGYIAGTRALVELLKYTNPGFVYSVGHLAAERGRRRSRALRELRARPGAGRTLHARSRYFLELCRARGIDTGLARRQRGRAVHRRQIGAHACCSRRRSAAPASTCSRSSTRPSRSTCRGCASSSPRATPSASSATPPTRSPMSTRR